MAICKECRKEVGFILDIEGWCDDCLDKLEWELEKDEMGLE